MFIQDIKFAAERLHVLLNGTITGVVMSEADEYSPGSYGLRISKSNGHIVTVWIDCDPEGNGPGWVSFDG